MKLNLKVPAFVKITPDHVFNMLRTAFRQFSHCETWIEERNDIGRSFFVRNSGDNLIGVSERGYVLFRGRRSVVTDGCADANMVSAVWDYLRKRVQRSSEGPMTQEEFFSSFEVLDMESQEPDRPWYDHWRECWV